MGQGGSKAVSSKGGRVLRYSQDKLKQAQNAEITPNPLVADSPGALGAQEIELAERLGKTQEASSDDLQKDPVLSSFLDELSGRVNKRPVAEYEGKMQPDPIKRRQRGQSEALSERRLSIALIRSLLEDSQQPKFKKRASIDVQKLADSYEIDAELLGTILKYNALPVLHEAADGRISGSWPKDRQAEEIRA